MELQWPLMLFTLFLCLGAGVMFFQGVLALRGKGAAMNQVVPIVSAVLVALGGFCAFLHLEHWERFFNGFGHITSGITLELIFVAVFVAALVIVFVVARKNKGQVLPQWCAIVAIACSAAMVLVMSLSYLMASRPAWNNVGLVVFYLADMVLLGSFVLMVIACLMKCDDERDTLKKWVVVSALVGAAGFVVYALCVAASAGSFSNVGHFYDPTDPSVEIIDTANIGAIMAVGSGSGLFWGGLVLGAIAPLGAALALWKSAKPSAILPLAAVGLLCAVAGSLMFRCLFYVLGFSLFGVF